MPFFNYVTNTHAQLQEERRKSREVEKVLVNCSATQLYNMLWNKQNDICSESERHMAALHEISHITYLLQNYFGQH